MPDRCAYCGKEEDVTIDILLNECPICEALHCSVCGAMIEFAEPIGVDDDGEETVMVYRSPICKVHLPWNIIEGIKRRSEDD